MTQIQLAGSVNRRPILSIKPRGGPGGGDHFGFKRLMSSFAAVSVM